MYLLTCHLHSDLYWKRMYRQLWSQYPHFYWYYLQHSGNLQIVSCKKWNHVWQFTVIPFDLTRGTHDNSRIPIISISLCSSMMGGIGMVGVSRITQTVSECEENILYFVVSCKCCFDPWSTLNWFQMINFARSSQWVQKLFFFRSSFMTITFKSQLPKYIIIWCDNKLLHNVAPYERILTASLGSGKAFIY